MVPPKHFVRVPACQQCRAENRNRQKLIPQTMSDISLTSKPVEYTNTELQIGVRMFLLSDDIGKVHCMSTLEFSKAHFTGV